MPLNESVGDFHIVNLGSVSNPYAPDLRASYVILDGDEAGYRITQSRVDYDRAAVIAQLRMLRHPGAAYIISHLSGQRQYSK